MAVLTFTREGTGDDGNAGMLEGLGLVCLLAANLEPNMVSIGPFGSSVAVTIETPLMAALADALWELRVPFELFNATGHVVGLATRFHRATGRVAEAARCRVIVGHTDPRLNVPDHWASGLLEHLAR